MPIAPSQKRQLEAILTALKEAPGDAEAQRIAKRIENCRWDSRCYSPFCPRCRGSKQKEKVKAAKEKFANATPADLYFLTILLPATSDITSIDEKFLSTQKKRFRDHLNAKALSNPSYKSISYSGAFEIDVKHHSDGMTLNATKTLNDLGFLPTQNAPAYLPHFHLLIHAPGTARDNFRDSLCKNLYPGFHQVRLQSLSSKKTIEENIEAITTYSFKFRVQKSDNIDTSYNDDENAPNMRRTVYKDFYEPEIIRDVVKQLHSLNGFHGLTFKSI